MISQDELGGILSRPAMADETALALLLDAAFRVECGLLPGDLDKLVRWAKLIRILRSTLDAQSSEGEEPGEVRTALFIPNKKV